MPPPLANAGGWIARSQAAGPQANSQAPRSLSGQGSQGCPQPTGPPMLGRDPLGMSGFAKSNRQNRSGSTRLARHRPGWGTRYPHLPLLRLALRQFARLDRDCTDSVGARPREETGGMGLFACQPIRGNPPPARHWILALRRMTRTVISHVQISYRPTLHDTSRAPSLAIGPVIAVLIPQYVRSSVFGTLHGTEYTVSRHSIPRSRKSQLDGWRRGCVSHMQAPWKPRPDQMSVCLGGGSQWKNIHPVILHGSSRIRHVLQRADPYLLCTHGMADDGRWRMDDSFTDLVQDTHPHRQDGIHQSALLTAAENHGYVQK